MIQFTYGIPLAPSAPANETPEARLERERANQAWLDKVHELAQAEIEKIKREWGGL